jgi:hypothetical protein
VLNNNNRIITIYKVFIAVTVVVTVIITTKVTQISAKELRVNKLYKVISKLKIEGTLGVIIKAPVLVDLVKVGGTPRLIIKASVFVDSVELVVKAPVLVDPAALKVERLASAPTLVAPRSAVSVATLLVAVNTVKLNIKVALRLDKVITDVDLVFTEVIKVFDITAENIVNNSVFIAIVNNLVKIKSTV